MDMADAINVLMHANPREDGSPGCAVWDIFRPEDADGLREFLLEKYAGLYKITDPIHSQQFYLDSEGRQELFEKKGIYSYRIYQYTVSRLRVWWSQCQAEPDPIAVDAGASHHGPGRLCPSGVQPGRLYEDCLRLCQPA